MADKKYYIVEARLPVQIDDASSVDEAARKAARKIQRDYGVDVSNWFCRVFEYGGAVDRVGPIEHFSNPAGTKFRDKEQNVEAHNDMFENGKTPNDDA